jgi:hypothetical protein
LAGPLNIVSVLNGQVVDRTVTIVKTCAASHNAVATETTASTIRGRPPWDDSSRGRWVRLKAVVTPRHAR